MTRLLKHTQSLEVADLVRLKNWTLSDALHWVLGGIQDGSGPRTSEVADEAMRLLAERSR